MTLHSSHIIDFANKANKRLIFEGACTQLDRFEKGLEKYKPSYFHTEIPEGHLGLEVSPGVYYWFMFWQDESDTPGEGWVLSDHIYSMNTGSKQKSWSRFNKLERRIHETLGLDLDILIKKEKADREASRKAGMELVSA